MLKLHFVASSQLGLVKFQAVRDFTCMKQFTRASFVPEHKIIFHSYEFSFDVVSHLPVSVLSPCVYFYQQMVRNVQVLGSTNDLDSTLKKYP